MFDYCTRFSPLETWIQVLLGPHVKSRIVVETPDCAIFCLSSPREGKAGCTKGESRGALAELNKEASTASDYASASKNEEH